MEKLTVATVNSSNFFHLQEVTPGVYKGIGGFEYELLKILSSALKFDFDVVTPEDGTWGHKNASGQYGGLIGMLQRGEADMVIEIMTVTHERSEVVDFAFPHAVDRVSFAIKKARILHNHFAFVYPFQFPVWITLILLLLLCSILFVASQSSKLKVSPTYFERILTAVAILTGNGTFKDGDRVPSRIIFSSCTLAIRFLTLCFSAVFLSFLMSPIMEPQITTFMELARASRNGDVKVTTIGHTFLQTLLMDEHNSISRDLSIHLKEHPTSYTKHDATDNIPVIMKGFAFIENIRLTLVKAYTMGKSEDLFYSEDSLQMIPVAIAFKKDFCCVEEFSRIVMRLYGSGILDKIFNDHLYRLRLQSQLVKSSQIRRPLSFSEFRGIFLVLIVCCDLTIVICIAEIFWWQSKKRTNERYRKVGC